MSNPLRHPLAAVAFAVGLTIPWVSMWAAGTFSAFPAPLGTVKSASTGVTVAVSGLAVLGSAFLLAWGAETAEKDVPRAFAIAVLAVLAVAPEYAVDALYAWTAGAQAGTDAGREAANLAVANMTGANRILIGIGWSGIALFTIYRAKRADDPTVDLRSGFLRDAVKLDRDISVEITFLLVATLYAFFVPLRGGIGALDTLVLVGLYLAYIGIIVRGDVEEEEEHVGVPAYLQERRKPIRIASSIVLFAYSGAMIYTAVHPFAHGLEELGKAIGIPAFFMIQWIAPLASEAPELIVVAYLVNKARSTAGFNALISSKLNQWTLLIGTLAVVYSIALGQIGTLPFDAKQSAEIWITAAQSFFALALLVNFEISSREAIALLVLFITQVGIEFALIQNLVALPVDSYGVLLIYTGIYLVLGIALFVARRGAVRSLFDHTSTQVRPETSD